MVTLNIPVAESGFKEFNVPTSADEITLDYIDAVTSHIRLSPNYAIVAVIIAAKPFVLCDKNPKQSDGARAMFKLVRKNDPNNVIYAEPGELIICAGTDVMRGIELTAINNVLNTNRVRQFISSCGKTDKGISRNPYTDLSNPISSTELYTVTFKCVPLCDIHGSYKKLNADESASVKEITKAYWK